MFKNTYFKQKFIRILKRKNYTFSKIWERLVIKWGILIVIDFLFMIRSFESQIRKINKVIYNVRKPSCYKKQCKEKTAHAFNGSRC